MLVWNTLKRTKWISLITPKPSMTKILQVQQSTLKQYKQGQKLQRTEINPTINSLLSDELQQLCRLTHYSTSVSFLQKNQIQKSYNHLQFAFTEAKGNFPQSVNLHMFLKNRLSILEKILGKNQQFVANLEEIFFMCLSLKGEKSLETVKHLHNYMIALAIYDSAKLNSLIQYLHQSNMKLLLKKSEYFISLNRFFSGDQSQAIAQIDRIIGETQKNCNNVSMIDKMVNNVCWFKILSLTKQNLEIVPVEQHEKLNQILDQLIRCLLEAQKQGQLKADSAQIQKNLEMTNLLQQYLETKKTPLIKLKSKTLLLNSQSPIIAMNIAHTLYLLQKYEQSSILMRIAIQTSIQLHQPYRLGLGLILLAKINHRLKLPYQDILIDMLNYSQRYSDAVVMECLFTYSRFLFMQMRYYQAESYVVQGESVRQKGKARMEIQGIVLPDFDFEF